VESDVRSSGWGFPLRLDISLFPLAQVAQRFAKFTAETNDGGLA
jgi:hypothetical protein